MECFVGIDLGSTTTKAVVMDDKGQVLGRGITNSRSNYDTAARVSKLEAFIDARLSLIRRELEKVPAVADRVDEILSGLTRNFRREQFVEQLGDLEQTCVANVEGPRFAGKEKAIIGALTEVFRRLREEEADKLFAPTAQRKSDFFRDLAGSRFMQIGEEVARDAGRPERGRRVPDRLAGDAAPQAARVRGEPHRPGHPAEPGGQDHAPGHLRQPRTVRARRDAGVPGA